MCSYCIADLHLCFSHRQILVFSYISMNSQVLYISKHTCMHSVYFHYYLFYLVLILSLETADLHINFQEHLQLFLIQEKNNKKQVTGIG